MSYLFFPSLITHFFSFSYSPITALVFLSFSLFVFDCSMYLLAFLPRASTFVNSHSICVELGSTLRCPAETPCM